VHNLESVVLPLAESRALVEHGIVLDAVFQWTKGIDKPIPNYTVWTHEGESLAPAPVLSELLDAIRAKVHPTFLGIDSLFWTVRWIEPSNAAPLQERSTSWQNDLDAAAALLMGASK
jgi:hypothetical protein